MSFFDPLLFTSEQDVADVFAEYFFQFPSVYALSAFVPIKDPVLKVTNHDRVLGIIEQRCLLPYSLFGELPLGDVESDRDVLERLVEIVEEGDNSRVDPIDRTILCAIA